MKSKTEAIADAFETVSLHASYQGRWIMDMDFVAIIRLEYGLPDDPGLSVSGFNEALSRDGRFRFAAEPTGNGKGTFRNDYNRRVLPDGTKNTRSRIRCYYVTNKKEKQPSTESGQVAWYTTVESFDLGPHPRLAVSAANKKKLLDALVADAKKTTNKKQGEKKKTPDASSSNTQPTVVDPTQNTPVESGREKRAPSSAELGTSPPKKKARMNDPKPGKPKGEKGLNWNTEDIAVLRGAANNVSKRSLQSHIYEMEKNLFALADSNPAKAYDIMQLLQERMRRYDAYNEQEKAAIERKNAGHKTVDQHIVDGVRHFLAEHRPGKKGGMVSKEQKDAVDAVQLAACFAGRDSNVTTTEMARRLGVRRATLGPLVKDAEEMRKNQTKFSPAQRKTRSDCYQGAAAACVLEFCHSEEGSYVDAESKRVYMIKDPETKKVEPHPARVWNEHTVKRRHEAFLESDVYKKFQAIHGKDKTIGIQRFRENQCRCVKVPSNVTYHAPT